MHLLHYLQFLWRLSHDVGRRHREHWVFRFGPVSNAVNTRVAPRISRLTARRKGQTNMATVVITNEQQVSIEAKFKTAGGNPGRLQGPPAWSVDRNDLVELILDVAIPQLALVRRLGPIGDTVVTVSGRNAAGDLVTASITVTVVEAPAVAVELVPGTPEQVPPAPNA